MSPNISPTRVLLTTLRGAGRGRRLVLATALSIAHEAAEAAVPIMVGILIDQAITPADPARLLIWLALLAVNFIVLSFAYRWATRLMVTVYGYGEHELRNDVLRHALHPRGSAAKRSAGDLLSLATSDTYRSAGIAWTVAQQSATVAGLLVASIALLVISVPLGLGVLVATALFLVGMQALSRPIEARGSTEQRAASAASEVATDIVSGLRILRGLRAQAAAAERYRVVSGAARHASVASTLGLHRYLAVSTATSGIFLALLTLTAGLLALRGLLTLGELVTVVGLAQYLQGGFAHVGTFASNWVHKRASARRIADFLTTEPPIAADVAGVTNATGLVTSTSATRFAFVTDEGHRIEVAAGSTVGIVPDSPSHARTLSAKLGYRRPLAAGEVLVDGIDAVDLGPDAYRSRVMAPPHDALVFSGTLADNLFGATPDPQLLTSAALEDVAVPDWDREVGEAGRRLSGGQRQRLLLARALAGASGLIVLDEPTSALDPATEQRIATSLREARSTVVLITRSPILLAACDHVLDAHPRVLETMS
jgi:ABC-type multidrug transport system fused ATPase/permease subunit